MSAFSSRFLLDLHKQHVQEYIDMEGGGHDLRLASLKALKSDDRHMVIQALAFLLVVGKSADLAVVDTFAYSQDEAIKKAATTCLFELRKRAANEKK